jgi:hypothetical protein
VVSCFFVIHCVLTKACHRDMFQQGLNLKCSLLYFVAAADNVLCLVSTEDCVMRSENNEGTASAATSDFGCVICRWLTVTCVV